MDVLLPLMTLVLGALAGVAGTLRLVHRTQPPASVDEALIREDLHRLHEKMTALEHQRVSWQSTLHQQVDEVRHSTDTLRRETAALATALRKPQVRGRWGELHLRRTIELAGMVEHCDFTEQVHLAGDQGALRPDVVVHLAGGASVVVDAKVPAAAYLDALEADEPEQRAHGLARHARQLRHHVDQLAGKAYWRELARHGAGTPEFVVLFVPAESFLSAALEAEPDLLEHAAARNVVIATPTTLIALLRAVAHGWTTATLAERTREIHQLGRDLYDRLGTVGRHLDKLGRALSSSVESYNSAVGSLESRVLVTARHFSDVAGFAEDLDSPRPVTAVPRPLAAVELVDGVGVPPPERRSADLG